METVFAPAVPTALDGLYQWGLAVIRVLQGLESPPFTAAMRTMTHLGDPAFYMAALLFVYWCIDEKRGFTFALMVMLSGWFNGVLKLVFAQPRPYQLDPSLGMGTEPTYGFPSGHAQMSLVFWGALAGNVKPMNLKKIRPGAAWGIALGLVLAVSFTRVYLGLHFPTDVFGGWLFGALTLILFGLAAKRAGRIRELNPRFRILASAALAFLMNASGLEESLGGLFLGFCVGRVLCVERIGFSAGSGAVGKQRGRGLQVAGAQRGGTGAAGSGGSGTAGYGGVAGSGVSGVAGSGKSGAAGYGVAGSGTAGSGAARLVLRYLLGMAALGLLYFLLRALLPGEGSLFRNYGLWGAASPLIRAGRFLRYGALGLFAAAGAPWLFIRLGLASRSAGHGSAGAGADGPEAGEPDTAPDGGEIRNSLPYNELHTTHHLPGNPVVADRDGSALSGSTDRGKEDA